MTNSEGFRFAADPLSDPVFADAPDSDPAAVCRGVGKAYRTATESVPALVDVSVAIPHAQVTVVIGPSGSGKSSLLRVLGCIDPPDTGEVFIAGRRVDRLRPRARRRLRQQQVAYLFQRPSDNLLPYLDAVAQIRLAASLRGAPVSEQTALELLGRLGLADRADHQPGRLSGGEQQRLAVACGVVGAPALVVADEPTAELDTGAAERVLTAIEDLAAAGVGFVLSSHDPRVMAIADSLVRLDHGRLVTA
jgi:putative ABC transport system ATP-binding protein